MTNTIRNNPAPPNRNDIGQPVVTADSGRVKADWRGHIAISMTPAEAHRLAEDLIAAIGDLHPGSPRLHALVLDEDTKRHQAAKETK
jgi:hypothetical protein